LFPPPLSHSPTAPLSAGSLPRLSRPLPNTGDQSACRLVSSPIPATAPTFPPSDASRLLHISPRFILHRSHLLSMPSHPPLCCHFPPSLLLIPPNPMFLLFSPSTPSTLPSILRPPHAVLVMRSFGYVVAHLLCVLPAPSHSLLPPLIRVLRCLCLLVLLLLPWLLSFLPFLNHPYPAPVSPPPNPLLSLRP
jgi:hypothetical protein